MLGLNNNNDKKKRLNIISTVWLHMTFLHFLGGSSYHRIGVMENISGLETVSFSCCEITLKRRAMCQLPLSSAFLGVFASQSFQRCQN